MDPLEMIFIAGCTMCVCGALGMAGVTWLMARRPHLMDQCAACRETARTRCKEAMDKAQGIAKSWFGKE
jgi:hypothetical protein